MTKTKQISMCVTMSHLFLIFMTNTTNLTSELISNTRNFVAAAKHHLTFAPSANKRTVNLARKHKSPRR